MDYEYSCFMERAFDIANHFDEFAEYNCNTTSIPSPSRQREFIRSYLDSTAAEEDVDALYEEVQPFLITPNMFWGLWGLLQCVYSSIDADFARYSIHRIQLFLKDLSTFLEQVEG